MKDLKVLTSKEKILSLISFVVGVIILHKILTSLRIHWILTEEGNWLVYWGIFQECAPFFLFLFILWNEKEITRFEYYFTFFTLFLFVFLLEMGLTISKGENTSSIGFFLGSLWFFSSIFGSIFGLGGLLLSHKMISDLEDKKKSRNN